MDGWMGVWEELRDSKECDKNILYKILNKIFLKRLKVKKNDLKRDCRQGTFGRMAGYNNDLRSK